MGNLIGLYSEWHSRLLPYYSFDQFVHKAEQVAATKRVKVRYSFCFFYLYSYFVVEGSSNTIFTFVQFLCFLNVCLLMTSRDEYWKKADRNLQDVD